ncbi:MAG TPA: hypothetical protein VGN34_04655 [Ktedonobacteraceae bacterium]|jgi:hypothetical protein
MENKQPLSPGKTIAWVYGMVAAFTAAYLAVPILLERWSRKRQN